MAYDELVAKKHDVSVEQLHDSLETIIQKYTAAIAEAVAAAVAALPAEMFLNHTKTDFVSNFVWSAAAYPGSTNPNLEGKPVFVFAIDSVDNVTKAVITTYTFMDMSTLVDTYTTKTGVTSQAMTINGYEVELHFDPSANNALTVTANGMLVDISGKMNRVTTAVNGNIAVFDANGNVIDSGHTFATNEEITDMLADLFPTA